MIYFSSVAHQRKSNQYFNRPQLVEMLCWNTAQMWVLLTYCPRSSPSHKTVRKTFWISKHIIFFRLIEHVFESFHFSRTKMIDTQIFFVTYRKQQFFLFSFHTIGHNFQYDIHPFADKSRITDSFLSARQRHISSPACRHHLPAFHKWVSHWCFCVHH